MRNAEYAVLKHILTSKTCAIDFIRTVDNPQNLFANSAEAWIITNTIFSCLRILGEPPTLRVLLDRTKEGAVPSVTKIYEEIMQQEIVASEYKHDLDILKQRYKLRQLGLIKKTLLDIETLSDIEIDKKAREVESHLQTIIKINNNLTFFQSTVKDGIKVYVTDLANKKEGAESTRIPLGFEVFDIDTNGGVEPDADLIIIAGETNTGKSIVTMTAAVNVWLNGNTIDTPASERRPMRNVLFFSLEMPYKSCFNRFIAIISGVDYFHIESGKFLNGEKAKVKKAFDFINEVGADGNPNGHFKFIDFYGKKLTANMMNQLVEETCRDFIPNLLAIDYIGLMAENVSSQEADWLKLNNIVEEVRAVLRARKVSAISPWQILPVDGGKYTEENSIGLFRLNRSKGIAQHVTHVIQLVSHGAKEKQYPTLEYAILKVREGIVGGRGRFKKDFAKSRVVDDKSYRTNEPINPDQVAVEDFIDSDDDMSFILGAVKDG